MTGKGMMSSIVLDCRLSLVVDCLCCRRLDVLMCSIVLDCPCCRCLGHRQRLRCRLIVFAVGVVIGERRSRSLSSGRRRPGAASILVLEFVLMMRGRDRKKRRGWRRKRQEEEEEVSVLVLKEAGTAVGEIPGELLVRGISR